MDWLRLGKVKSSKNKQKIIKALTKPKTPTELSAELKLARSTCSNTLLELEKLGICECLNPKLKMGRLYKLTDEGLKIKQELEKK